MIKTFNVSTRSKDQLIDITPIIKKEISRSNITEGICIIYCPHTTAGITINESADPDVKTDILNHLSKIIPRDKNFKHSEGNSDSHIKSSLLNASQTIIIHDNKAILGTWQNIYFAEFDGPRQREVMIKIIEC